MIVSSCPLRISLVGGSTDHPHFLEKYGEGSVISFPCNLRVYVTVHKDIAGLNALKKKYVINYTKREEVDDINDIENDVVRETLKWFNIKYPLTISLTSDISSAGSGLASSSAYIMALIKALHTHLSEFDVCTIASKIERKFNPLVGQQDFYGSMSGGIKRINFFKNKLPTIQYITDITALHSMSLIHTGVYRQSTEVLSSINVDKCVCLLEDVNELHDAFLNCRVNDVYKIINRSWQRKKDTSNIICENSEVAAIDELLTKNYHSYAHKLCGAGNGGYFLNIGSFISLKDHEKNVTIPIKISKEGLKVTQI